MKKIKQSIAIAISIILCFSLNQPFLNGLSKPQDINPFTTELQSIKEAPGGVLIDFDDLTDGTIVGGNYAGVSFTPGFYIWDSTASALYPPMSSPNTAYSFEVNNNITFANPVSYVSLYISTPFDYNMQVVAYTSTDLVINRVDVDTAVINQFIEFDVSSGVIHRISITGDSGFNTYWAIDDLFYLEYIPTIDRTITFDDFEEGLIEDSYPGLIFSPGYLTINTSLDVNYPPESGDIVAYSLEINNWFIFEMPVQKVGFFISTAIIDYEIVLTAYTDQTIIIEEIPIIANTPNQYVELMNILD